MKVSAILATGALIAMLASASAAEPTSISLFAGYSETIKLHKRGATLVVGDDSIADATSSGDRLVITGKAVGTTNLIVLDESDAEVYRAQIKVGSRVVVIGARSTRQYVCTPSGCRVGDGNKEPTPSSSGR